MAFLVLLLQPQADEQILRSCEGEVNSKFKQWRLAPLTPEVKQWAEEAKENPTTTWGDFDGDTRKDVALLIQLGPLSTPDNRLRIDTLRIAVCLNTAWGTKLHVIEETYCGDGISTYPKGGQYYDFETDKEGVYKLDGVHAYCFEKAGATFEFENGSFRKIVDSD
jgi:hypothetical protein